jgi:hypothetical protein
VKLTGSSRTDIMDCIIHTTWLPMVLLTMRGYGLLTQKYKLERMNIVNIEAVAWPTVKLSITVTNIVRSRFNLSIVFVNANVIVKENRNARRSSWKVWPVGNLSDSEFPDVIIGSYKIITTQNSIDQDRDCSGYSVYTWPSTSFSWSH